MRKIVYPFASAIILPLLILCFFPEKHPDLRAFLLYQAVFLPLVIVIRNGVPARHHHSDMERLRRLDGATKGFVFLELALTGYGYIWFSPLAVGTKGFLVLSAVALSLVASADNLRKILPLSAGDRLRPFFLNFLLVTVSLGLAFTGLEFALQHSSIAESVILPEKWQKRTVDVAGSVHSYYWHGKLHVHDDSGFRRTTPFPPKNPGRFRIVTLGDSLTYGYGIADEDTYASLTERALSREYSVEVFNLGRREGAWQKTGSVTLWSSLQDALE